MGGTMVTKESLAQYIDLCAEIEELRAKISRIEQAIERIEREGTVKDAVKGGVGGLQTFHIEGFPYPEHDKLIVALMRRRAKLSTFEAAQAEKVGEIEDFLETIEDSHIRRIINLRFVEGLSWNGVADRIGGNASEDSVRKAFTRYIAK